MDILDKNSIASAPRNIIIRLMKHIYFYINLPGDYMCVGTKSEVMYKSGQYRLNESKKRFAYLLCKRCMKVMTNLETVEFERLYNKNKLSYKKNKHTWNPSKKYYNNGFTYTQNDIDMFDAEYSKLSNFNIFDQLFYSPQIKQNVNQSDNIEIVNDNKIEIVNDNKSEIVNDNKSEIVNDNKSEIVNDNKSEIVNNNKSEIVNDNKSEIVNDNKSEIVNNNKSEIVNNNNKSEIVNNNNKSEIVNDRKILVKKYKSNINKRSDTLRSKRMAIINKKKK